MNTYQEDSRMFRALSEIKVKCKNCGHTMTMPVSIDSKVCSWCKKKVQNNSRRYFKYRLIKELRKPQK